LRSCFDGGGVIEQRPFTPELRGKILAAQEAMGEQGLRVRAFASRRLESPWTHESLEQDLVCAGLVGLQDRPGRKSRMRSASAAKPGSG